MDLVTEMKEERSRTNTHFKKNSKGKWTWEDPIGPSKSKIKFNLANKISTIKDVSACNKFRKGSDHGLIRTRVVLDLKTERMNLIRKSTTFGININNLIENSDRYQRTPNELLHDEIYSP